VPQQCAHHARRRDQAKAGACTADEAAPAETIGEDPRLHFVLGNAIAIDQHIELFL
jgi:hypothetical protein